ncbi:ABC transporter ATP-binding protein [Tetragenococcus halophilus]|uniref:ABC transporter ATP-binding protein n=1 Tax=Tetragenococcus halophilus TaxID=51669 RepID=UPI00209A75C9|nr:ABC transporter ATP-binding protein [Tetragenococcus halophilus]MCO8288525.1 ABC transporter ATP-binding protein [Tetragenococcus halophilus]
MIKKLLSCVEEYKKTTALSMFLVIFESFIEILIPTLMAIIIDEGISQGRTSVVWQLGVLLILLALLGLFIGALSGRYAAIASAGFAKNLRRTLFFNVQQFSFSNIDKFTAPSLITRMTTDVTNLQNAYQMLVRIMIKSPVQFSFAIIMSALINPNMVLIFIGIAPFLAGTLIFIGRKVHPIFERVFRSYDHLNNIVQENLHGIRVVKSYVRQAFEVQKFQNISQVVYKRFSKAEKLLAFNQPLMQSTAYICILLISWVGAHLIVGQTMSTGELSSLFVYTFQILISLNMFSMVFVMFLISRASAQRVVAVMEEESDLKNNDVALTTVADGRVHFHHVFFQYPTALNHRVLKDISFSAETGETIGIVGGTGSSKTTLVQLIPRLYDVTDGQVELAGRDVGDYDMDALRQNIGVVLQNNILFSGTIMENIRWGNPQASKQEVRNACVMAQADEFIQELPDGYQTYIEQGGSNVSGGQRQRLCIARALLKQPKVLILDDSTSAVDTKTESKILEIFRTKLPYTTKFIVAQRITSVQDADKILVLDNGEITDIGTHHQLLQTSAIYQEIYEAQTKGFGEVDAK